VLEEAISQIESLNSELCAFINLDYANARQEALASYERFRCGVPRGPLDGILVGLKDLFETKGIPTTAGSLILRDYRPSRNAAAVETLHNAGANTFLGKLNMHEFAYGPTATSSYYVMMKNPHDPSKMAGGSSGGSAIAVAAGMVAGALGTDTGGSVRIPAAFCGVYGLKPSYGSISRKGVLPLSWTLDHVGPIARDLDDIELLWRILSHRMDHQIRPLTSPRVLWVTDKRLDGLDLLVQQQMADARTRIGHLSAVDIVPGTLPRGEECRASQQLILGAEAVNYHWAWLKTHRDQYQPDVRDRLLSHSADLAIHYIEALRRRSELIAYYDDEVMSCYDFIVTPTVPIAPPPLTTTQLGGVDIRQILTSWTAPFNLLGLPALSLPIPPAHLGIGLQIVGSRDKELELLAFARDVEAALA
jgi:aspartyl-tRNA(Asn)/glutamyl-tRNA(Gln) amidotransferase subunit A